MRKFWTLAPWGALSLLALSGCGSNQSGMSPSALTGAAAAASVASLASPDVPIFQVGSADTSSASAGDFSGAPKGPGPCVFDDSTGQFSCPDVRRGGLSLTRKFILRDAAGNIQSSFDKTTTESIEVQTSADGTISRPGGGTVTIHRTGDMTTSGLAGAETTHTLNGTEQGTVVGAWTLPDGTKATENTTIADSTQNLVIPVPVKDDGGTMCSRCPPARRAFRCRDRERMRRQRRRRRAPKPSQRRAAGRRFLDGTGIVQVVMTVNGQTKNCTVDLSNHTSTCGK